VNGSNNNREIINKRNNQQSLNNNKQYLNNNNNFDCLQDPWSPETEEFFDYKSSEKIFLIWGPLIIKFEIKYKLLS